MLCVCVCVREREPPLSPGSAPPCVRAGGRAVCLFVCLNIEPELGPIGRGALSLGIVYVCEEEGGWGGHPRTPTAPTVRGALSAHHTHLARHEHVHRAVPSEAQLSHERR